MKKLNDLQVGDTIYLYGVGSLSNGEFVIDKELEIVNINKVFTVVTGKEIPQYMNPVNHIIKSNEGVVFRNQLWLSEPDKELAKKLLLEFFDRKIEIAQNSIKGFNYKKSLIENHFNKNKEV